MKKVQARCLYCYEPLSETEGCFHVRCSKKFFNTAVPPTLPYSLADTDQLGRQIIGSKTVITGVQPKLSLGLTKEASLERFTLLGLWGDYILKPPTKKYPSLPEVEDLTMHLAELFKIEVVPHSLIRLKSGELVYITRRIDRKKGLKLHMEDPLPAHRKTDQRQIQRVIRTGWKNHQAIFGKFRFRFNPFL